MLKIRIFLFVQISIFSKTYFELSLLIELAKIWKFDNYFVMEAEKHPH